MQFVVLTGNPADGYAIIGPFNDGTEAVDWAEINAKGEDWHVVPITAPYAV